jgi:photosystem II stability/assembly factor-like uncharacterized protein
MEANHLPNDDFVYGLAASPKFRVDGLVFAAKKSGLSRSTDKGKTWKDAFASLNLSAPLPISSVTVALAGEITYVFAGAEGQILCSLDAGQTWQSARLDTPAPLVTALAASPNFAKDGTLLAATMQDGIFRSTDRGITWTGWNFGLYDPNINALAFADSETIFAGTQSGVFRSSNAGSSWCELDFPIARAPVISLTVGRDGTIYAGTESEGLLVSRDEGRMWKELTEGAVEHIQLDRGGRILILKDGELLLSEDDGNSWQTARPRFEPASDIAAFATSPGLDSVRGKNLLVGLSNGEIIKL